MLTADIEETKEPIMTWGPSIALLDLPYLVRSLVIEAQLGVGDIFHQQKCSQFMTKSSISF